MHDHQTACCEVVGLKVTICIQVQMPDFSDGMTTLRALEKDFGVIDAVIASLEVLTQSCQHTCPTASDHAMVPVFV